MKLIEVNPTEYITFIPASPLHPTSEIIKYGVEWFRCDTLDIIVKESRDLNKVIKMFEQHKGTMFTYLTNIPLVEILSQLESFKIFVAEVNGEIVGCIHSLDYVYDCGYVGGLLVHRDFRKRGIGSRLLNVALNGLSAKYVYLFVEEENTASIRLVEKQVSKTSIKGATTSFQPRWTRLLEEARA